MVVGLAELVFSAGGLGEEVGAVVLGGDCAVVRLAVVRREAGLDKNREKNEGLRSPMNV